MILFLRIKRIVDPGRITDHLRPNIKLISVIYANNEIGTIQSISEISKAIKKQSIKLGLKKFHFFHIDACQAPGALPLLVEPLHVDLMTLNGRKISGPTGVGVLFVKRGVKLRPIMFGGGQERGLRPGTENVEGRRLSPPPWSPSTKKGIGSAKNPKKYMTTLLNRLKPIFPLLN